MKENKEKHFYIKTFSFSLLSKKISHKVRYQQREDGKSLHLQTNHLKNIHLKGETYLKSK